MHAHRIGAAELVDRLAASAVHGLPAAPLLLVEGEVPRAAADLLAGLPRVVAQVGKGSPGADVVAADEAELALIEATVEAHPSASVALAVLLRGQLDRTVAEGLVAESATYSMLQSGPEFARWLERRPAPRPRPVNQADPVVVDRVGDELRLTLNRPEVRNAFSAAVRDALLDGLAVAEADPDVQVVVRGEGPSFCSGGDLQEFGTASDPAAAHRLRLARSVGRVLASLAPRVTAEVHGACVGAGTELPAFAGRVVASPDARFRLPEVGMGLVPGAGGTVSVTHRVGRSRTAWMALTGGWVDAATALRWGLVDEVVG